MDPVKTTKKMTTNNPISPEALSRFTEAQRLAEQNLGRCQGRCKRVMPLYELVTTIFRDTVAMSICPDCFATHDLIIGMAPEGLKLQIVKKQEIVLAG